MKEEGIKTLLGRSFGGILAYSVGGEMPGGARAVPSHVIMLCPAPRTPCKLGCSMSPVRHRQPLLLQVPVPVCSGFMSHVSCLPSRGA